uniref:Uncharacterized protein n=1 Tax=Opuntia streptacantha TaxID=393608 RepID=A0A7C9AYG8_OPUST
MQRVKRGSVHEIFEWREDGKHPSRNNLKVAVTHVVHEVDVSEIGRCCSNRVYPYQRSCQQWYGKENKVSNVFREWMNHRSDGLSDNGRMMMRVVARVEEVMVQRSMEPVIQELHRANVKQHHKHHAISSPQWQILCTL